MPQRVPRQVRKSVGNKQSRSQSWLVPLVTGLAQPGSQRERSAQTRSESRARTACETWRARCQRNSLIVSRRSGNTARGARTLEALFLANKRFSHNPLARPLQIDAGRTAWNPVPPRPTIFFALYNWDLYSRRDACSHIGTPPANYPVIQRRQDRQAARPESSF